MFSYKQSLLTKKGSDLIPLCCNGLVFLLPCSVLQGRKVKVEIRVSGVGAPDVDFYWRYAQPGKLG